jgi:hypothetical protein
MCPKFECRKTEARSQVKKSLIRMVLMPVPGSAVPRVGRQIEYVQFFERIPNVIKMFLGKSAGLTLAFARISSRPGEAGLGDHNHRARPGNQTTAI